MAHGGALIMASDTRYSNKPGGVFVHVQDEAGTAIGTQHVKYGEKLPDNMTPGQAKVAERFSTTDSPKPESDPHYLPGAVGSSTIAADEVLLLDLWGKLDEQGAVRFIASLKDFPKDQAAVVVHEQLGANRREVIDAASDEAKNIAEELLTQQATEEARLEAAATGTGSGTPTPATADTSALEEQIEELRGQVEALKQGEITGTAPEVDPEDYTEAELRDMAEKAGVEDVKSGDNKSEIADKINAHNAAKAAAGPTPAASPEG